MGAIEEIITKSKTGRRVIAYKTTVRGNNIIKLGKELADALSPPKSKR